MDRIEQEKVNPVEPLKILDEVFGVKNNHYSGRLNPEIMELESIEYQEDYFPVFCTKCDCKTVVYGTYDGYDEGVNIICAKDYERLPKRPEILDKLKHEREVCLKMEFEAGIIHNQFDFISKIPVPQLSLPE